MKLPRLLVTLATTSVATAAAASTGGLAEGLIGAFAVWCGIPTLVLAVTGALVPRFGYWRSLGALIVIICAEFAFLALTAPPGGRPGEMVAGVLLASFYGALLHASVYWVMRFLRRFANGDDARRYADAQQRVPADGPASRDRG